MLIVYIMSITLFQYGSNLPHSTTGDLLFKFVFGIVVKALKSDIRHMEFGEPSFLVHSEDNENNENPDNSLSVYRSFRQSLELEK